VRTPASQTGRYRRGVGVATGYWLYLWQPGSKVELKVKDGRLVASTAIQDIGTGSRTVIANTVAHEFGLEPHEIEVHIGDSNLSEGPGSGGSRTPHRDPAHAASDRQAQGRDRAEFETQAGPRLERAVARHDRGIARYQRLGGTSRGQQTMSPGVRSPLKEAGFMGIIFGWMMRRFSNMAIGAGVPSSVQVIEVEVDTWLGHVRVLNVHTALLSERSRRPRSPTVRRRAR